MTKVRFYEKRKMLKNLSKLIFTQELLRRTLVLVKISKQKIFFFLGQGLFPAATAAKDADELWGLFWTEEILELIIQHTNRRVYKMMEQMNQQLLANDSGLGPVDMVS
jgi:hypothetical protein